MKQTGPSEKWTRYLSDDLVIGDINQLYILASFVYRLEKLKKRLEREEN